FYDTGAEDIYSTITIRQLSQEFGISMQQGEDLFEAAIDYLIRRDQGSEIGMLVRRAATASGAVQEQAVVDAFAAELAARVSGLTVEEADEDIRKAFEAYRSTMEVYGEQLSGDLDAVRSMLMPLLAVHLGVDLATAETYFDRAVELCADYQTEMDRIIAAIAPHLPEHDCVASEGEGEGEGEVDFCVAFAQVSMNALLGQVGDEYGALLALLDPAIADINGPFHVDLADDQNYVIDVTGNGLLDAGSELGLLSAILSDAEFDNGVLTHSQARAAWDHNWNQLLNGNIGPVLAPVLPPLVPGLMELLVGYVTLGDGGVTATGPSSVTGSGSFGFVAGLLSLLEDALQGYFGSGFANPVLDKADFTLLEELAASGDADGDGYTNAQEYAYFTPVVCFRKKQNDPSIDYVTAALHPRICPDCEGCPECRPSTRHLFRVGEDACLAVPGDVSPDEIFIWSREGAGRLIEGRYVGARCKTLLIPNLQIEDTGTYTCQYPGEKGTYSVQITVAEAVPAADVGGLMLISLALPFAACVVSRLRKRAARL
ncbi:MAG TPA: immunoglobulin domain-containing protein, partial [Candidatus Hydrogenedentes bacterium]|nr:immunoglobulin domain-containing protein [Candidatus Hydrogenedentota bacterium]